MNAEVNKLLKGKDTAEQLQTDGVSPAGGTPEAFRNQIRKEVELWRKAVADIGVKVQ
jgi:tripartite-type tricarboxylate transporter receptor subunit TctC